jgi:hypothetical protein
VIAFCPRLPADKPDDSRIVIVRFPHGRSQRTSGSPSPFGAAGGEATGGGDSRDKPRSHDTSRIAWAELVRIHDDRNVFQASPVELPVIDIHSL